MKETMKKKKNPMTESFGYAFEGIWTGIRNERNMKIHCLAIIFVTLAGTLFQITATQWCICLLLFALDRCAGTGKYCDRSSGGSCNGREKAAGEDRERYGSRGSAVCRDHIGDHRLYHISAICIGTAGQDMIQ